MKFSTGISIATVLFVCFVCINSKPTDVDQLNEHQILDSLYPTIVFSDDIVERAAPRLGRASPRLGRASPRLGRHAPTYVLSRLNHAGRYYIGDEDGASDYALELDSSINEKRAAPRLGRSV
ncbi:hypothetical protein I4U23_026380 [Adineta vaga]|nr:hypothetical protein I4U23_026380 [Adineta vaga]